MSCKKQKVKNSQARKKNKNKNVIIDYSNYSEPPVKRSSSDHITIQLYTLWFGYAKLCGAGQMIRK